MDEKQQLSEKLPLAIKWFTHFIMERQGNSDVDFERGYLGSHELYKRSLQRNAHEALGSEAWSESMIGTGEILGHVIRAYKATSDSGINNIVEYHNLTKFENKARADLTTSEGILYRLFLSEDPGEAFEAACSFWGRWFPELSYLMFVRDGARYVPVKTNHHRERFHKLGIGCRFLSTCTWQNYEKFVSIHEAVRRELEVYLGRSVSLLDTHSFIWALKDAPEDFSYAADEVEELVLEDEDEKTTVVFAGGSEGRVKSYYGTRYERKPRNRAEAIRIHGLTCMACGFNFARAYGELGEGFIEVHHIKPLHSLNEEVVIDPKTDLVCLCANCHRIVHRKRGAIVTVEELMGMMARIRALE